MLMQTRDIVSYAASNQHQSYCVNKHLNHLHMIQQYENTAYITRRHALTFSEGMHVMHACKVLPMVEIYRVFDLFLFTTFHLYIIE